MSDEKEYPSLGEKAKNLANFSWELVQYITQNRDAVLFVSDEVYKERVEICKTCDKFAEFENMCTECGCYIPAKAKIILDSCPLAKWSADKDAWESKFNKIAEDIDKSSESL